MADPAHVHKRFPRSGPPLLDAAPCVGYNRDYVAVATMRMDSNPGGEGTMVGALRTLDNGVVIHQATEGAADKCNIYCEYPWVPPDASCFVYVRHAPEHAPNTQEYVACDFGTWRKRVVGRGCGGRTMANGGLFYYRRLDGSGHQELIRCDLQSRRNEALGLPEDLPGSGLAISKGERYLAFTRVLSYDPQMFAVGVADLQTGSVDIIHEDPWVCNPHLQFEPRDGRKLMVQHNRGCVYSADGGRELLVGKEGCTLFLLDVPGGEVTRLNVGPPHTASLSGHETWLGESGGIICTLNYTEDYDYGKGRVVQICAGGQPQEICAPWELNHIGVEPSGRIFAGDAYRPDEIVIGCPGTHRACVVCSSGATYNRARRRSGDGLVYDSHPHAYITPDRRWVVYNSDATGVQQIYVAEIPPEMVRTLENDVGA